MRWIQEIRALPGYILGHVPPQEGNITFARRKRAMLYAIVVVSVISFAGGYARGAGGTVIFLMGLAIGLYIWRKAMVPALIMLGQEN